MLRSIYVAGLVMLALMIAAGCSDDDECPSCPTNVDTLTVTETLTDTLNVTDTLLVTSAKVLASGYCYAELGILDIWLEIFSVDGDMPAVDSVTGAGEIMPYIIDYDNATPNIQIDDPVAGDSWTSGDTLEVVVYTPEGAATCNLEILDRNLDQPNVTNFSISSPWDTVEIDTEIEVYWNTVEKADWYNYYLSHHYDSAGHRFSYSTAYTMDTSLTIPIEDNGFNGYWYIGIYPITGPYPDDADGNFVGSDAVKGVLLSYSNDNIYIYVGTGDPGPWLATRPTADPTPPERIREILGDFYLK